MKVATIFSGGEGVGVGMRLAGIEHLWGIEHDDEITSPSASILCLAHVVAAAVFANHLYGIRNPRRGRAPNEQDWHDGSSMGAVERAIQPG